MQDYLKHNSSLASNKSQQKKNIAADKPIVFNPRIVSSGYNNSTSSTKSNTLNSKLSKSASVAQLTSGKMISRKTSNGNVSNMKSVVGKLDFVFELAHDFKSSPIEATEKGVCISFAEFSGEYLFFRKVK